MTKAPLLTAAVLAKIHAVSHSFAWLCTCLGISHAQGTGLHWEVVPLVNVTAPLLEKNVGGMLRYTWDRHPLAPSVALGQAMLGRGDCGEVVEDKGDIKLTHTYQLRCVAHHSDAGGVDGGGLADDGVAQEAGLREPQVAVAVLGANALIVDHHGAVEGRVDAGGKGRVAPVDGIATLCVNSGGVLSCASRDLTHHVAKIGGAAPVDRCGSDVGRSRDVEALGLGQLDVGGAHKHELGEQRVDADALLLAARGAPDVHPAERLLLQGAGGGRTGGGRGHCRRGRGHHRHGHPLADRVGVEHWALLVGRAGRDQHVDLMYGFVK